MSYKVVFMRKSAAARAVALTKTRDQFALRALLFSGLFVLVITAFATSAIAQTFRFSSITVEGNNRIEYGTVLTRAGLAENQGYSAAELNDAYQALIGSGLFESVEIEPNGARLNIVVVERPTINRITFEGNSRINTDDLRALVTSEQGRVFNPLKVEQDAAAITAAYSAKGRVAATISPKIIRQSDNRVDLVFEIIEGGIVEIEDYLRRTGRFDQLEECPELHFLREWETEVESARPMSKLEQLREELRLAVERDQFERAADLRDRLRDLERKQVSQKD